MPASAPIRPPLCICAPRSRRPISIPRKRRRSRPCCRTSSARPKSSRWSARLQTGLRSQSNASFFPTNGLFLVGGVGVLSPLPRRADFNAFELVDIANDTDLDAERSAQLETRFKGYATQQFHLASYNVGVFGLSSGPRFALDSESLPGASVKPYVTGLTSYVGGGNFLNSGGAGVVARLPLLGDNRCRSSPASNIAISASPRRALRLAERHFDRQRRHRLDRDDLARLRCAAPRDAHRLHPPNAILTLAILRRDRGAGAGAASISIRLWPRSGGNGRSRPMGGIFQLAFDAVDPMVDPWRPRRDIGWAAGVLVEAPVTREIGLSAAFEYARNEFESAEFPHG